MSLELRVVLMLASLEGVLLKNSDEPIQQNLGERLAMLTKEDPQERMKTIGTVRKVYGLRSRFLHHTERPGDTNLVQEFMLVAWVGLLCVVEESAKYATVEEFATGLDIRKMS